MGGEARGRAGDRLSEMELIEREAGADGAPPSGGPGWRAVLGGLSVDTLQWTVGLCSALIGAFMLVAPHQFDAPPYRRLLPHLALWGIGFLGSGIGLLSVPVLRPRRAVTITLHGLSGFVLLGLAFGFATGVGPIVYVVFCLGVWIAAFLPGARRPPPDPPAGGDLFALMMSLAGTVVGLAISGLLPLATAARQGPTAPLLPWFGLAFLLLLPALGYLQVRPGRSRPIALAVHAGAGSALLLYGLLVSYQRRTWTGVAIYLTSGLAILLLPWLRGRLAAADAGALRVRLALALALTATVALILAVAVVTDQEERLAAEQALEGQRIEAASVAEGVHDYLSFNGARLAAVATIAGLAPLGEPEQQIYLEQVQRLNPDVSVFAILDRRGGLVASSGSWPFPARVAADLARSAFRKRPLVGLRLGSSGQHRLLVMSAPIRSGDGRPVGVLAGCFLADDLAHRLERAGSRVALADGKGQLIAYYDRTDENGASLPAGWDAEVAAGREPPVGSRLATFALVPELGWAVAVERPRSIALAGERRGRDLAFALLVLCMPLAIAAGVVTARRIARPLGSLADAVDQVTAGNLWAPLSPSSVSEVARLSAAFRLMRDRLAARTAESERLAAELIARAEALAESDRRKDEFLAMLAHELRNPLGAIANAAYVLEQTAEGSPQTTRATGVVMRQTQHLVRLVDDLLDVSRITRGKVELRREPHDLAEVVRQAVESNRPLIEERGHALEVSLPIQPLPIVADGTRLEQVFSNLLRNAAKFTVPGGSVAVSARTEGGRGVVRVHDTGIGISPELLPRIFDLFTQGELGLDRAGAGLGIGLTMVKRLVELHGGEVEVRSEGLGRGAEFVVRLPLAPRAEPPAPEPEPEPERQPVESA